MTDTPGFRLGLGRRQDWLRHSGDQFRWRLRNRLSGDDIFILPSLGGLWTECFDSEKHLTMYSTQMGQSRVDAPYEIVQPVPCGRDIA
jgi:hypothetical protein